MYGAGPALFHYGVVQYEFPAKDTKSSFHKNNPESLVPSMNIPFPVITPPLIDSSWFNSDSACDEEAELAELEQAQNKMLNRIGQKYKKAPPVIRNAPEPMEEVESDEEEGNEESDESEESHDEEEEDRGPSYSQNTAVGLDATTIINPEAHESTENAASESDGWT